MFIVGKALLWLFLAAMVVDIVLLWVSSPRGEGRRGLSAFRQMADRFSNGDDNEVRLRIENSYPFAVKVEVIDEIPFVFQRRDICFRATIAKEEAVTIKYQLHPTRRGTYGFGHIRAFAASPDLKSVV